METDNIMKFAKFMTSGLGRAARIVLGLAVMSLGMFVVQGMPGMIMTVVALVPISGGLLGGHVVHSGPSSRRKWNT